MARQSRKPPLADISIAGRALRGRRRDMKTFISPLLKGLVQEAEAPGATETGKAGLTAAHERLRHAEEALSGIIVQFQDTARSAKILAACYSLMGATADAVSRIERKRLPQIIEKMTKSESGKTAGIESGNVRAQQKDDLWRDKALELATKIAHEHPGWSTTTIADAVRKRWGGDLPVAHRTLYEFLCARKSGGSFQKVHV